MKVESIWKVRVPSGIGEVVSPRGGDVQRDVPGMIQPGRAREADLADDLGPQLQRFASLTPRRGRQFRPGFCGASLMFETRVACREQVSPYHKSSHRSITNLVRFRASTSARARRGTGCGNTSAAQSPAADCAPVDAIKRISIMARDPSSARELTDGRHSRRRECRPRRISHAVFSRSRRSRVPDSARPRARFRSAGGCRRRRRWWSRRRASRR